MIIYWIYINPFSDEKTYGIPKDQGIIIPYRGSPLGEIIHFVLPCNHNSPSHNTFRTASHPLPHPSIQLLPPRTGHFPRSAVTRFIPERPYVPGRETLASCSAFTAAAWHNQRHPPGILLVFLSRPPFPGKLLHEPRTLLPADKTPGRKPGISSFL